MTERIVHTERRLDEGDRYAPEIAITASGTLTDEAKAPEGRRFVLEDALHLIEDPGRSE